VSRYCIDQPPETPEFNLKVCWFDIEVGSDDPTNEANPIIEEANLPICSIVARTNGTTTSWIWGKEVPDTRSFKTEKELLNDFLNYIKTESPDAISAWNLDGFDLPYLIKRCRRVDVDITRLSKIYKVKEKEFKGKIYYQTLGTIQFDLLQGYKLWRKYGNFPELASYSLDFVAKTILGEEKLKHGKSITWLWHNDPQVLINYNIQDVELLEKIDERCKIFKFFDNLRKKGRCQFLDVYKTTSMWDGYLISHLAGKIILPSRPASIVDKFKGADVLQPTPGLYDYVAALDVEGMYPSIIDKFNISYETVGGEMVLPLSPPISFKKGKGLIPSVLGALKIERNFHKKEMKKYKEGTAQYELHHQMQYGIKIFANSGFGYLGYPGSRLYKKEVAESITGMGRYIIHEIISFCQSSGYKVIYSDTDSTYVHLKGSTNLERLEESLKLQNTINEHLEKMCSGITDNPGAIKIALEKIFRKMLFTDAKKRYAYIELWKEKPGVPLDQCFIDTTEIHIQGFDQKRSDTSQLSKIAQADTMSMIMSGKTRTQVQEHLRAMNSKMKKRELPDEVIGIPKGIKKPLEEYWPPSPTVKGALFSNQYFDTNFTQGTKPKIVYISGYRGIVPEIRIKGKVYKLESIAYDTEIPKGFEIDWNRMSDVTFSKKLKNIFNAVGWHWTSLDEKTLW
jgi:DNA polymerase I